MAKIFQFSVKNDIDDTNSFVRCSGAFDYTDGNTMVGGGIAIDQRGDVLECITNGTCNILAQRSFVGAIWAENQIAGAYVPATIPSGATYGCGIDNEGRYYTADASGSPVKMYRYSPDSSLQYALNLTLASGTINGIIDIKFNHTSGEKIFVLLVNGAGVYQLWYTTLDDLTFNPIGSEASFIIGPSATPAWTEIVDVRTQSATWAPYTGIAFDTDDADIYIVNHSSTPGNRCIWKIEGPDWTGTLTGRFNLPATPTGGGSYLGLGYRNKKLFVVDSGGTVDKIHVLPMVKQGGSYWWRAHDYAVPFKLNAGAVSHIRCIDFNSDGDFVAMNTTRKVFQVIKSLENNSVMQVNAFIDSHNVLPALTTASCMTPVVERFFEPNEFYDYRDCPDKFYMGVGYYIPSTSTYGILLLHLNEFLSDVNGQNNDRFDTTKIRIQDFQAGGSLGTNCYMAGPAISDNRIASICIEKDMVFWTIGHPTGGASSFAGLFMLDLKLGTSYVFESTGTYSRRTYTGTTSTKNSTGYSYTGGVANTGFNVSAAGVNYHIVAQTFGNDDISDYNKMYPTTYVVFDNYYSTVSNNMSMLTISWDQNGNRTPLSMLSTLLTRGATSWASPWIAPSGYLFVGHGTGVYKSKKPMWEIIGNITTSGEEQCGTVSGMTIYGITQDSPCWKVANTWEHRPIIFGSNSANGVAIAIADDSTTNYEAIHRAVDTTAWGTACNFEDKIFSRFGTAGIYVAYRQTYTGNVAATNAGTAGWMNQWYRDHISLTSEPRFISTSDSGYIMNYSPETGLCCLGNQFVLFGQNMDKCQHESIDFDCENPKYYFYRANIKNDGGPKERTLI